MATAIETTLKKMAEWEPNPERSLNNTKCSLNDAKCSLNHAKCSLNHAKRSLNDAKCSLQAGYCYMRKHAGGLGAPGVDCFHECSPNAECAGGNEGYCPLKAEHYAPQCAGVEDLARR